MEKNKLGQHFTYRKLLKFVAPCIFMMIVTSVYSIVDGFFVSNFAGKNAFAAVNLVMPVLMAIGAFGFMIGTGGSALVAFVFGTGNYQRGKEIFSMLVKVIVIVAVICSVVGFIFMPQIVELLGASQLIMSDSILYGRIILCALVFFMLQNSYQSFLVTADKAGMGLAISILSGVLNMILDFLFVYVMRMGVAGAAIATAISQLVGAVVPTIYFWKSTNSQLHFVKSRINLRDLGKACVNGSSEMLTNLSASIVDMLYNFQLIKIAQENGVAAYGVIMYVSFIFMAIYFGYAVGINPVIGYHYGAKNHGELKNLLHKSIFITAITAIIMTGLSEILATPLARVFVGYDAALCAMTSRGMELYALSFLLCGFNIFASAFFTGLGSGIISATISVLRTLVIQVAAIFVLPLLFGVDGIWFAIVAAEGMTLIISAYFLISNRKRYGY